MFLQRCVDSQPGAEHPLPDDGEPAAQARLREQRPPPALVLGPHSGILILKQPCKI